MKKREPTAAKEAAATAIQGQFVLLIFQEPLELPVWRTVAVMAKQVAQTAIGRQNSARDAAFFVRKTNVRTRKKTKDVKTIATIGDMIHPSTMETNPLTGGNLEGSFWYQITALGPSVTRVIPRMAPTVV